MTESCAGAAVKADPRGFVRFRAPPEPGPCTFPRDSVHSSSAPWGIRPAHGSKTSKETEVSMPTPARRPAGRSAQASTEQILIVLGVAIAALAIVTTFGYKVQRLWRKDIVALDSGHPPLQPPIELGTAVDGNTSATPRPFPADGVTTPEERTWDAAVDVLNRSEIGREALRYAMEKGVGIRLSPGGPDWFNPPAGPIEMDANESPESIALTFVHELQHARGAIEGTVPDIMTSTRDDYVNGMIMDEVIGTVASIESKLELVRAGVPITATFPLEAEYVAAYNQAVADARAANPAATPAELDQAGKAAGLARVVAGFHNGEVSAGNSGQTYPQYYGSSWDSNHP